MSAAFRAALLDPGLPVPAGLVDPAGRPAGRRFDVYRNNVTVSLIEALETGFPVLRRLLGPAFFRGLAREFLRAHPPESPLLMFYGTALPGWLERAEEVAAWPYLPDIARLELLLRRAHHAADAPVLDPAALSLPPERLLTARMHLAPAVGLLTSPWPVWSIWRANTADGSPPPKMAAEEVLVGRPGFDPVAVRLPPGGAGFVAALQDGSDLGTALEAAPTGFDLGATLRALLAAGALAGIGEAEE